MIKINGTIVQASILLEIGICNIENLNDKCYHDDGDCCNQTLVGNKECDKINFFKSCAIYDGGDCCSKKDLIGNGYCDSDNNNPLCNFDGGECGKYTGE